MPIGFLPTNNTIFVPVLEFDTASILIGPVVCGDARRCFRRKHLPRTIRHRACCFGPQAFVRSDPLCVTVKTEAFADHSPLPHQQVFSSRAEHHKISFVPAFDANAVHVFALYLKHFSDQRVRFIRSFCRNDRSQELCFIRRLSGPNIQICRLRAESQRGYVRRIYDREFDRLSRSMSHHLAQTIGQRAMPYRLGTRPVEPSVFIPSRFGMWSRKSNRTASSPCFQIVIHDKIIRFQKNHPSRIPLDSIWINRRKIASDTVVKLACDRIRDTRIVI